MQASARVAVSRRSDSELLGERRLVTAVLRLVLDRHDRIVQGQVVAAEGRPARRFVGWRDLGPALRAWVTQGDGASPSSGRTRTRPRREPG
jgi:hypothetical protein